MSTPILDTAVAWWHADRYDPDVDTEWLDQSGNGHDAQLGDGVGGAEPTFLEYVADTCLFFPGQSNAVELHSAYSQDGNYANGTDLDIQVRIRVDDYTAASLQILYVYNAITYPQISAAECYRLVLNSDGKPRLRYGAAGVSNVPCDAAITANGFGSGEVFWLRVTLDYDNGSGDADIKFYTSPDGTNPGIWTQLGTTQNSGSTSAPPSGASVRLWLGQDGFGTSVEHYLYRAIIKEGIAGTTRFDWDTSSLSPGDSSDTPDTGSSVTIYRGTILEPLVVNRSLWGFEGAEYFEIPDALDLDATASEDFTYYSIFRSITNPTVNMMVMDKGRNGASGDGWSWFITSNEAGSANIGATTFYSNNTPNFVLNDSEEHGFGAVIDQTTGLTLEAFLDGIGTGSPTAILAQDLSSADVVRFGATSAVAPSLFLLGALVGCACFKSKLSDADMLALNAEMISDLVPPTPTEGRTPRGLGVSPMRLAPMGIRQIAQRNPPAPAADIWFLRHDGTDPGNDTDDLVVVPTWDAVPIDSNPSANDIRTVEAWVRLPALPGAGLDAALWTCGVGGNSNDYTLIAQDDGDLVSNHWFDDMNWAAFWNTRLNVWGHLAITYDGNVTERVYWNGVLVSAQTLGSQLATTRTDWWFYAMPSYNGSGRRLRLDMFDWRIWAATRTQPQIAANMGAFLLGTETDLMLNYKMQDGSGLTLLGQGNSYDPLTLNWADDATIDNTNARLSWEQETDPR